jgi:hypothetical protein
MAETKTLMALFEDIDPAADGIDKIRELGVSNDEMNVISGIPVTEPMLGRPHVWTNVPRLALGGSLAGFAIGLFLTVGTKFLYPISVGGQPFVSVPPTIVIVFEMTMLGLLISTFLGVFLDSYFPSYAPKEYVAEISDGKIAVIFDCPAEKEDQFIQELKALGAEDVVEAEAQQL